MRISFDIDVAAPIGGVEWIPARRHYSHLDDGLVQPWQGRVWMNPPFSEAKPWVEKFLDHRNGIALLPFAKSRWLDQVWDSADAIALVPPETNFIKMGKRHSIFFRTFLAAFSPVCVRAIERVSYTWKNQR